MVAGLPITDLVTIEQLPDLGAISDASSFVSEHAGTGRHTALAFRNYIGPDIAAAVPLSALVRGCVADGVTNNAAAINAAFAVAPEVWFPAGVYAIGSNVTIPAGKRVVMLMGASFAVAAGITLTINGLIDAGMGQIFSGLGSVVGLREVRPEWWGARINQPTFNSQPALQSAAACVQNSPASDGTRPTIRLGAGSYYLATTWTVSPTANCQLQVLGLGSIFGGTRLVPMAGFPAAPVMLVDGQTDSILMISDWLLHGFGIIAGGGSPTAGLQIGRTTDSTHRLIGLHQSLVEDVTISGINNGIQVCHARLIKFDRCSVWNQTISGSTCVSILEAGWFTGDLDFVNCQLVGNSAVNSTGMALVSTTISDGLGVAGVRIRGLFTAHCDRSIFISASGVGSVHDVWIEGGSQFDFAVSQSVFLVASGAGSYVRNVQLSGVFIDGGVDQITLSAVSGGQVMDTRINGCWLAQASGRAVIASAVSGVTCTDNFITDNNNTAGAALQFTNAARFTCGGNVGTHTTTNFSKYLVQIDGTSDYYTATGNVGAGIVLTATVIDTSSGTHKVVANNV